MSLFLLLLSGLGDPDWQAREACQAALACAGPQADPVLCWGQWSSDPELRRRVDELLQRRAVQRGGEGYGLLLDALAADGPYRWPWCDSLPPGWPGREGLCCAAADRGQGGPPEWPAYRAVTAEWVEWRCRCGEDWRVVLRDLRMMREREREIVRRGQWR